jgi:altronate dehydratase small subunit
VTRAATHGGDAAWHAIVVHPDDDVAVALRELAAGETIDVRSGGVTASMQVREAIPLGHKFALHPLAAGAPIRKYGEAIGVATVDIPGGSHVHVHNLASRRARPAR